MRQPAAAYQPALVSSAASFTAIDPAEADALLIAWGHYLGGCARPFGVEAWALEVDRRPVAVAVGASTASSTVAGRSRFEVVELARLCSAPGQRWATRPMLRLWREIAAPRWPHWTVTAAVAYSQNARHDGSIYRFDGWTKVTDRAGTSQGGGTWSNRVAADHPGRGVKTLWLWSYPDPS